MDLIVFVTPSIEFKISSIVFPALITKWLPSSTFSTESLIRFLISPAAAAARCAKLRTSVATTAKPRPCSPALAASTAAFNARILVWNAMLSITEIISTILREDSLMPSIVLTTCPTATTPFRAKSEDTCANAFACLVFSLFFLMVSVNWFMLAVMFSRLVAWSMVRCDKS